MKKCVLIAIAVIALLNCTGCESKEQAKQIADLQKMNAETKQLMVQEQEKVTIIKKETVEQKRTIKKLEDTIAQQTTLIERKDAKIADHDALIAEQKAKIAEQDELIAKAKTYVSKLKTGKTTSSASRSSASKPTGFPVEITNVRASKARKTDRGLTYMVHQVSFTYVNKSSKPVNLKVQYGKSSKTFKCEPNKPASGAVPSKQPLTSATFYVGSEKQVHPVK